jgi:DNA-directed RNA polymerases I, II, and III subunit RPABC2
MDEYRNEVEEVEEEFEEEVEMPEGEEEDAEAEQARMSEAADLQKMFRQHPEIWIPYEEQVQEKLPVRGIGDPHHTSYPRMTQYEFTKAISFRASMLCNGAKPYIVVPDGVTDSYQIAKMELLAKRLPFIFKRPLPNGQYEYWKLADLLLP